VNRNLVSGLETVVAIVEDSMLEDTVGILEEEAVIKVEVAVIKILPAVKSMLEMFTRLISLSYDSFHTRPVGRI
jgi:hypothetical protein